MKFLQKAHIIICGATSQQVDKHRSNEKYWPIIEYVPQVQKTHSEVDGALNSLLCLLHTPVTMPNSRHCSHSHSVISASIQSSQNSGGCWR